VGHRGVRRRIIVATVIVATLVLGALLVRHLFLNDSSTALDAKEALDRFRDQTTVVAVDATRPAAAASSTSVSRVATTAQPGVYRYTTAGVEQIDVLGGTQHDYPAETTITVTPSGCGVQLRWDLLRERYEEFHLCGTTDGIVLQPTGAFYHEFFQHGMREEMRCDRPVGVVPFEEGEGPGQQLACTLDDRAWAPVWKVMERTIVHVADVDVKAVHVQMTIDDNDEYWEHTVSDWWFDEHGLPVKMTTLKESKSSSDLVGDVVYTERYSVELASFTPLQ
jgi:hypothetical protein